MQRKEAATSHSEQVVRIARLLTFIVPLALTFLLLAIQSGQAAPPTPPQAPPILEEEFEAEFEVSEDEDLVPEEACIEAEEEFEADELDEDTMEEVCGEAESATGSKGGAGNKDECTLRSANAHAATKNDRLKLTIGYTTSEPTNATVEIKQGSVRLGTLHPHLGRSGVLRFAKQLGKKQNGKLLVRIKLPSGTAGCPSRRLVLFPR